LVKLFISTSINETKDLCIYFHQNQPFAEELAMKLCKLKLTGQNTHKQPNLELKTLLKQFLGSHYTGYNVLLKTESD
jgi:hypothetical protein